MEGASGSLHDPEYVDTEYVDTEYVEPEFLNVDLQGTDGLETTAKRGNGTKRKKSRTEYFSSADKKLLAEEVKNHPVLWDLSHREHYNNNAVNLAWKQIGAVLNRTAGVCKTAWIALRESHRYHIKIHHAKSGSEGGTQHPEQSCDGIQWEFAEDLAFLPDRSKKRRTYTSTPACAPASNQSAIHDEIDVEEERITSNYDYQTRPSTSRSTTSREDETVVQLADNINLLIQHQRSLQPPTPAEQKLVHYVALANIDRMLQQLPPSDAEDACFELTALLYNKIKTHRVIDA